MSPTGWVDAARDLPIADALDPLRTALADRGRAVLHAPPGAGKTTIVPLAMLDEPWCTGRVLVLEPRRLAVRAAARRMSDLVDDRPGGRIGWRMRQDTAVSAGTRIEVITEGVLTRRLQRDPELEGVSAVVFDEFHERSLDADFGLALTLDVVGALRPDLRIVVMSATLDVEPIAALLDAPVVRSEGRLFPVETVHLDTPRFDRGRPARMEGPAATAVQRALAERDGDILVFLPGAAEIDRCHRAVTERVGGDVDVRRLHGSLPTDEQDRAIQPSPPGRRKVVLSTSIAETSLTIEGVTAVVDAGWRRTPRLDPASGMTRLVTLPVTRAEADQRAGRAGRLAPGAAYRLWSAAEHATLRAHPEPEIEVTDLAPLALELAAWGAAADELAWLTPPPAGHLAAARTLLARLDLLDETGAVTAHGRTVVDLPLHPRLGHLLRRGAELGHGPLAADLAAVLHEHRLQRRGDTDATRALAALRRPDGYERAAVERARTDARRWRRAIDIGGRPGDTDSGDDAAGLVIALGYPDRIGRARPGARGEFLLANGRGAFVDATDPLAGAEFLCAIDLDGRADRARIRRGVALDEADVRTVGGDRIRWSSDVRWDDERDDVVAEETERLDAVVLTTRPASDPDGTDVVGALLDGIDRHGIDLLAWTDDDRRLQDRLGFLHRHRPDRWPDVSDDALVRDAAERLVPHLTGVRRRRDLRRVPVREVLLHGLDWSQRQAIDRLAPERIEVPSGNRHRVDYAVDPPVLAAKLQELFGSTATPTVLDGEVAVVLHLLSPAGRPLQVTQDLPSFWAGPYAEVRAEMRGRYPKHPWPEDPTTAEATARTKRRR